MCMCFQADKLAKHCPLFVAVPCQVIMNAACDSGVLEDKDGGGSVRVVPKCASVLVNEEILKHILLDWRIWSQASPSVWSSLLETLRYLVSEEHSHAAFNLKQFQSANVLDELLYTCQVSWLV